jgi:23S rRNA (uridine2552-2'-O)-methyltransferase
MNSKTWLKRHVNDLYVKKAQQDDLRSRSSYKLQEINDKFRFIKRTSNVLDLGAAPGGWSLIVSKIYTAVQEKAGENEKKMGKLIAVDLLPINPIPHCTIMQGNFQEPTIQKKIAQFLANEPLDVILSDMLHNTTGQSDLDHSKSMELCEDVLSFAEDHLSVGGTLLCKYLQGKDDKYWMENLKEVFETVKIVKPKSSRSESREKYILAMKKKRKVE